MRLVTPRLRKQVVRVEISNWLRIISVKHRATPAGVGFGASRFSRPANAFKVLYAADSFSTVFAEVVIRDRFEGRQKRFLYQPFLSALCVTSISASRTLDLVDLRGAAAYEAGIDTDTSRARDHGKGQSLSQAIHDELPVDGVLFQSRLSNGTCVAIYDRALPHVTGGAPVDLLEVLQLSAETKRLGITVRSRRGHN